MAERSEKPVYEKPAIISSDELEDRAPACSKSTAAGCSTGTVVN